MFDSTQNALLRALTSGSLASSRDSVLALAAYFADSLNNSIRISQELSGAAGNSNTTFYNFTIPPLYGAVLGSYGFTQTESSFGDTAAVAATATFTFSGAPNEASTIKITDATGTSATF